MYLPHKVRCNHPLTAEQKAYNAHLSSYRIVVEHTNTQLNQLQALSQVWHNQTTRHTRVVRVVAGLVNRRIEQTPLRTYAAPHVQNSFQGTAVSAL